MPVDLPPLVDRDNIDTESDPLKAAWSQSYPGLAAIAVFSVFINILRLTAPIYVLQILDRVIASRSGETLTMLTAITLMAIVSAVLLEVIRRRLFLHWGNWIERRFAPFLFSEGLNKGLNQELTSSHSLKELGKIRSFVSGSGLIAWMDLIWAPVFIACVFLISPPLGYIVLTGSFLTLVLGALNERFSRDSRNAAYKAGKDDRNWLSSAERQRESIASLKMVIRITERWASRVFVRLDESLRAQSVHVYFTSGMRLIGRFLRIAVLGFGVWLVISEQITLGAVIAAGLLGRTAYSLVQKAMLKWREMLNARKAYVHISKLLNKELIAQVSVPDPRGLIGLHLEKVNYRYSGQRSLLIRGLDVTVNPGELLEIIGPSAVGKSTVLRLISGLLLPRSGKVRFGNVDVSRLQQNNMQRLVAYLPQQPTLFSATVRENISNLDNGDMDKVVAAAKLAGVHQFILKLAHGYDTQIEEDEPLLSFRQRKCIALARAFYDRPALVVLDEPRTHLDQSGYSVLRAAIKELKSSGSIVVVSKQAGRPGRNADKAIVLSETKLQVLRTPQQIAELSVSSTSRRSAEKRKSSRNTQGRRSKSDKFQVV